MSDLISRRELINFLRTENQKCITSTGYELSFGVIATLIECQPIAYDPGKVVEELEKNKRKLFSFAKDYSEVGNPEMAEIYSDRASEYMNAIEIVKQGSVADDCCEWELCDEEANVYDTSCRNPHILINGTPEENNYEYCPYCGKKIKVAE